MAERAIKTSKCAACGCAWRTTISDDFEEFLSGVRLYGDDFTLPELDAWYREEEEGFYDLWRRDARSYRYGAHALNRYHGFRFLPTGRFAHALGLGSSHGDEFLPIIDRVDCITIVEPSRAYHDTHLGAVPVSYVRPAVSGELPFHNDEFDLELCFGALHHIPNVSKVVTELHRCLRPGGFALIREPVISMGDWRWPRRGLTKNERGIPYGLFRKIVVDAGFDIVHARRCMFAPMSRLGRWLKDSVYNYRALVGIDGLLSDMVSWNNVYHARHARQKLRPVSAFFVLKKAKTGGAGACLSRGRSAQLAVEADPAVGRADQPETEEMKN